MFFAYGGVLTFIPMYTRSLGMGGSTSLFFLVFALVIVVTRPFVGYLFDHHGPNATVYPGFAFFSLGFILFSQAGNLPLLLLSAAVLGIGFGALAPAPDTGGAECAAVPGRGGNLHLFLVFGYFRRPGGSLLGMAANAFGYPFMYGVICLASSLAGLVYYFFWRRCLS